MKQETQVLVINLKSAIQRRDFQDLQLKILGLKYEWVCAVEPGDVDPTELQDRTYEYARPLRPSEVSCLLSHREAWRRVCLKNTPQLILEDDAVLQRDVPQLIEKLSHQRNVDFFNLETVIKRKTLGKHQESIEGTRYTKSVVLRNRAGAGAYFLYPSGARKLLNATVHWSPLADVALELCPSIRKWQIEPAAAKQGALIFSILPPSSTAAGAAPSFPNFSQYLKGRKRRLAGYFTLAGRQLRYLGGGSERLVLFDTKLMAVPMDTVKKVFG